MKNLMFVSDFHILESDLPEISTIFDELLILKEKYEITHLVIAGDTFDNTNPNPKELDAFSLFIKKLNIPIILLAAESHESISQEQSVINHFGILSDTITVVREYQDENKLFVGHFTLNESKLNFGTKRNKLEFRKYRNVILGHQHDFQVIKPNICHIGSVRFIDFGEDEKIAKRIGICQDYDTDKPKWSFPALKSPYSLINLRIYKKSNLTPSKDAANQEKVAVEGKENPFSRLFSGITQLSEYLDKLDPKTKVRIIFEDYDSWREFLPLYDKYKQKFTVFRDKKDFVLQITNNAKKENNKTLKENLIAWMQQNKIEDKIKQILLEEIK